MNNIDNFDIRVVYLTHDFFYQRCLAHPARGDEDRVNAILKVQLKPLGLKFSICKVVAIYRHSVYKRLTHNVVPLVTMIANIIHFS